MPSEPAKFEVTPAQVFSSVAYRTSEWRRRLEAMRPEMEVAAIDAAAASPSTALDADHPTSDLAQAATKLSEAIELLVTAAEKAESQRRKARAAALAKVDRLLGEHGVVLPAENPS